MNSTQRKVAIGSTFDLSQHSCMVESDGGGHDMYCDGGCKSTCRTACLCWCIVQLGTSRNSTTGCVFYWGSHTMRTVDLNLCCIWHIPQKSKSLVSPMEISRIRQYIAVFLFIVVWRLIFPILAAWWRSLGGRGVMICTVMEAPNGLAAPHVFADVLYNLEHPEAAQPGAATTGAFTSWACSDKKIWKMLIYFVVSIYLWQDKHLFFMLKQIFSA